LILSTPFDMKYLCESGRQHYVGISILTNTTIVGNGAILDATIYNAGGCSNFFYVGEGVSFTMSNVSLLNGEKGPGGGAIINFGDMNLTACSFVGNKAEAPYGHGGSAGAIFAGGGSSTTLLSCNFSRNFVDTSDAEEGGGAIQFYGPATKATMSNCRFSGNYAHGGSDGGAIEFGPGTKATVSNCSFVRNQVGHSGGIRGGAIFVGNESTVALSSCVFSGNGWQPETIGGAIYVDTGGTITLLSCDFFNNSAGVVEADGVGGALYFANASTGLLKNCSLLGTVSSLHNDIARADGTANVTFACADGEVGTPVQMQGNEITKLPALTCTAPKYSCDGLTGSCKPDQSGVFPSKQACTDAGCTARPTPAPCQVPRNCGQHNNSVVCGHTFTGCEFVCGKGSDPGNVGCCHHTILTDQICNQCVEQLCKPVPPLPPPVTTKYACITTPNYHCVEFASGTFHTPTDCENDCKKAPAPSPTQEPNTDNTDKH
jgi:hypothetical protein